MQITQLIPSFNSGELSPLIHLRSDLEKYRSGCRTLENMLITPYGGARRRPGTEYIATTKDGGKVRLSRFQYSVSDSYVLEWGDNYMRVYRNGTQVMSGMSPYEIATPYSDSDLFEFQVAQINNIAYIVHPSHAPRKLSRTADDDWTLAVVDFETAPGYPPLLDENAIDTWTIETQFDDGTGGPYPAWVTAHAYVIGTRVEHGSVVYRCIKAHNSGPTTEPGVGANWQLGWVVDFGDRGSAIGQEIDLVASQATFDALQIDGYFEIAEQRSVGSFEVELKAIAANNGKTSPPLVIQGKWSFNTFGTWKGRFIIERSKDRGITWEDVRSFESDGDRNVSTEGEEDGRVLLRLRWSHDATGSSNPRGVLSAVDGFIRGLVRISAVTDSTHAKGITIVPVEKTVTKYWSEGAWSNYRGFPRTVASNEQRIVYGGNAWRTQSLWGSAIDDYENFQKGVEDDDSWTHSLAASEQNAIQWLLSQKQLLIGTSGGEWVLASSKDDVPVTPTNVRARRHSNHGSEYLPARLVNEVALFIQRGSRKVREMVFSFEADGYVSADVTMLAEHISEGGIVQTEFQQQRDAILWCVNGKGELIGLTYERSQNVTGWHRHVTGGDDDGIESVAVVSTPGEEDEVWLSVRRTINGDVVRYIERFRPDQFRAQVAGDLTGLFFVDSGRRATGSGLTVLTGLDHLEGETVQVIADGAVLTPRLVAGGKIELDKPQDPAGAAVLVAGLAFSSILEPMALEAGLQNGTSASREKRIHEVVIYFHQTSGCKVSDKIDGRFDVLPFRDGTMTPGLPPDLLTGAKVHKLDARHEMMASFVIKQDLPLPMTILAVVPKFNVYGDQI